jgi:PAS domain S-box-containing protein
MSTAFPRATPKRHSSDVDITAQFEELILRLVKGPAERQAIKSGQIDAIMDPATGRAILLPQAHQALSRDQARDRSLVKLSSDWQWEKDSQHRFVSCEGAIIGSSGFDDKTIIGKKLWDLPFDNMSDVEWRAHRRDLMRRTAYRDLELRSRDGAGEVHYFSVSGEPAFDAAGKFKGYRGTAREIPGFKVADAMSPEAVGIARATLDALTAQICVLDSDGTIVLANRAWSAFPAAQECIGVGIPEGTNYLAACDSAGTSERANAGAMAAGIRRVIAGKCELFRHEYRPSSPIGRHWFAFAITGLSRNGAMHAVISHEKTFRRQYSEQPLVRHDQEANRAPIANAILAAMTRREYQRMVAGLEPVVLSFGEVLYELGDSIEYVYFPSDCLISLLTEVEGRMAVEVGLVGSEGMVGTPLALGIGASSTRALVQRTGTALRMEAARFQAAFKQSPSLQRALYRYTHLLMAQFTQTAACNRFHPVEARLARWLLMTHDRAGSDQFHLTHEFLADMLGVRRVGITNAASALRKRKLIDYRRGDITILDRKGLTAASCACYRIVKDLVDTLQFR